MKAVLNNAYCTYGPPPILVTDPQKKMPIPIMTPKKKPEKKKGRLRDAASMSSSGLTAAKKTEKTATEIAQMYATSVTGNLLNRPELNHRIIDSPELLTLRNRMHRTATERGLNHVTNDSVIFMMKAVEVELLLPNDTNEK